jgi:signal transduction histidine kinase
LWIGTTVGLIKFNTATSSISHIYTSNDGLSNQYIYGIVPHEQYLWLSTNAGVNRFAMADGSVKIFSAADGLQSNEYNTYSFCKTANGEILLGGVNGLNSFNPQLLRQFNSSPALVLSSIMVEDSLYTGNINYDELTQLEVGYKQNTLAFQFTVIDYVNAAAAHTSYMLAGYDKSWVKAPNKSFIRYVNLPPGNYVLKVKAFNADGIMGEKVFELPVSVLPAWWQTWWFGLLVMASVILLTVVFVKNYLQAKLQKQKVEMEKELAVEQERIRLARELHDGLGSMLSGIKHSFSAIKNEVELNTAQEYKFGYTIGKLDDSIKDLRAVSHGMFSAELLEEGLVAAIKNYCNAISVTAKINIAFESIMEQAPRLSGEQAFHVFRVVQELVQNIVKHSGAAEAMVQLSYNNGVLALTVEDSGAGFDTKQVHDKDGIGLRNVEARVKMLHGKTDIRSVAGKGTSILVEIPVG